MGEESRDLIVVGGGPGGYTAAIRAAQLGRRVTLIEREALGGVCLNWGCIPSKTLLKTAALYQELKHASRYGIEVEHAKLDYPRVIERSRQVAGTMERGVAFLMRKNKVEVIAGSAELHGKLLVKVTSKQQTQFLRCQDLIIAVGAHPRLLPGISPDGEVFHTSRTILECKRLPQKILIIGAGPIGVEFAYFFNALGAQVTLIEMLPQILPQEDADVSAELRKVLGQRGVTIKTGARVQHLKRTGRMAQALIAVDGAEERWSGDSCLLAIGVIPNTEGFGCETAGIALSQGFITVDPQLRTSADHHYAIGDVCGPPLLAHKASHEGLVAAEAACGKDARMRYDNIPSCTYSQPQAASLGRREQELKAAGIAYLTGKFPFTASGKAQAIGDTEGFVKVLVDAETGEVLGAHIVHGEATELISAAALVRSHEGIAASVIDTIHPHPTLAEALPEAVALAVRRPITI